MRTSRSGWRYGLVGAGLLVAMAAASFATIPSVLDTLLRRRHALSDVMTVPVKRIDMTVTTSAGGRVDSAEQTTIECALENVDVRVRGQGISAGGVSTILSVMPEGSEVKAGDVLCVLDASDYEELERQQQMSVDRAHSDHKQAELNLEIARMAVREYRDGIMLQERKNLEGQIALRQSDYERALDRMAWSKRMFQKQYLAKSQLSADQYELDRIRFGLDQGRTALWLFKTYSAAKYLQILQSDVLSAEAILNFQDLRLERHEGRLAYLRRQVERCTIRAPHDGFLIYANEEMKQIRIEPGLAVWQRQRLFFLPDLAKMEVAALLHETVVKDVAPGQRARVRVEAFSDRTMEGHVASIAQLPTLNWFSDVKYYVAIVKLDSVPRGLKPGMTAEVEIQTLRRPDVLAIPSEAIAYEEGHQVCYVAHEDHLDRREVQVGRASRDMLEVTAGLDEGETVVLDPVQAAEQGELAGMIENHDPHATAGAK
jgi:HlyD family secretion protein